MLCHPFSVATLDARLQPYRQGVTLRRILVGLPILVKYRNVRYAPFMPIARAGRPYSTQTKLGQLMADQGLRKYTVCGAASIPDRTLTEILAGRAPIRPRYVPALCKLLGCDPEDIVE